VLRWLAGGAVVAGGAAGCTVEDPAVRPTDPPPAPPTPPAPPPPPPGLDGAVADESRALASCLALAERDLSDGQLANLAVAADIHHRHLVALALPRPQTRPGTDRPSPSGSSGSQASPSVDAPSPTAPSTLVGSPALPTVHLPKKPGDAVKAFDAAIDEVCTGHLGRAAATDGAVALLWASLAAGAAQSGALAHRSPAVSAPPTEPDHPPYRSMTTAAAARALLAQLHAIVFGYQVALAPLDQQEAERPLARLADLRHHRDVLAAVLRDQDVEVPVAEPEYDTGGPVTTAAAATTLIGRMEQALLPHLGNWVAAADAEHRRVAAQWLVDGTVTALRNDAAPLRWPGWPD